jgi:hypothetical protein
MAVFVVYALTAQYQAPLNNDTGAASAAAWQMAIHGNATLTALNSHASWLYHVGGREVTNRSPGVIFWAAPFYFVLGGQTAPDVYPGALAAAFASALAVALVFTLAASLVNRKQALAAALLLGFATGTWTVSADQLWTHGPAQVAVLLALILARKERWTLAGIPAGFAILMRPHLGVVGAVLGIVAAIRTRSLRPLLISLGCVAGIAILVVYNHDLWGRYSVFGGYTDLNDEPSHRASGFVFGIAGSLVSPERGLLVMTPVLLALVPGLRAGWTGAPWWVRSGTLAGLAYLVVQLWVSRFSGGDGFYSYRTTLEGLTLCVPLLTLAWRDWTSRTRLRRTAFAVLAVVSVALTAFGAIIPWVPLGNNDPWSSYGPAELARHIGALPTVCSVVVAVGLAVAAGRLTWSRSPTPAVS